MATPRAALLALLPSRVVTSPAVPKPGSSVPLRLKRARATSEPLLPAWPAATILPSACTASASIWAAPRVKLAVACRRQKPHRDRRYLAAGDLPGVRDLFFQTSVAWQHL